MRKTLLMFIFALLLAGASGCGCCRGLFGSKTTAVAKPVCAPMCAPVCDPCGGGMTYGAPNVTYGSPGVTYGAAPGY